MTQPHSPIVLPPLHQRPTPNQSGRHGQAVRLLVWHETAGHYAGDCNWLCNPSAQASAHIVVKEDGQDATQLVHLADKAWHAAAFNPFSVGVEHSNLTAKGYSTEHQLQVSARVFGWLCLHLNIPPRFARGGQGSGICRHLDLGMAGGGHLQCGPGDHDWQRFLAMVHHELERGEFRKEWAR